MKSLNTLRTSKHRLSVPIIMLSLAALFVVALEATRDDGAFNRDTFRNSDSVSSEAAVTVGGDRLADLYLPADYDGQSAVPLLVNLHGYGGDTISQSSYTFLQSAADLRGVAYIAPNGLPDSSGSRFWNASSACCNFGGSKVSDVDYLSELIKEISSKVSIDKSRIYLFGHSNGHFMSYKFACSTKGVVTAIAGLAGAMESDPTKCGKEPMSVLHIHGTSDATISYDGGNLVGNPYPSAQASVDQWASINSCSAPQEIEFELLTSVQNAETTAISYTCKKGALALWRINGGVHTPSLDQEFALRTLDWLLTHRKK